MKRQLSSWLFVSILSLVSISGTATAEEPVQLENGTELLILRNGQILEGRITKLKNHYSIDMSGGEMQVRNTDVEIVCRTLEEGYRRKRSGIELGNWQDHLNLARWCQKHEMFEFALAELNDAEKNSPNNPMIAAVRRQIEASTEPPKIIEKVPEPVSEGPSNEELDRLVRSLPPKTVESFTQTVQPMLMNNCTATGCHGPQATSNFRMVRVSSGQSSNRRLTQRNLYAVIQYIDRVNPAQSPLLTIPAGPHGTVKNAIYTEQRAGQYNRLVAWVIGLGNAESSEPSELLIPQESPKMPGSDSPAESLTPPRLLSRDAQNAKPLPTTTRSRSTPVRTNSSSSTGVMQASYQEPPAGFLDSKVSPLPSQTPEEPPSVQSATKGPRTPLHSATSSPKSTGASSVKRGASLPEKNSNDPFDPDVFNRRYHKNTPSLEQEKKPLSPNSTGDTPISN